MIKYDESMRDVDRAVFSDEELKEMGIYEDVVDPEILAIEEIEGQIECGYIDLDGSYPDELLLEVARKAIQEYKTNHFTKEKKFNINETVALMLSNDYKDRLRAEYLQLGYRIKKSVNYAISGNFTEDSYDVSIYSQIRAMMEYLEDLEARMFLSDIDIIELKDMLKEV